MQLYTVGDIDLAEIVRAQTMQTQQSHTRSNYTVGAAGPSVREKELEQQVANLKKKLKDARVQPLDATLGLDIESQSGGA